MFASGKALMQKAPVTESIAPDSVAERRNSILKRMAEAQKRSPLAAVNIKLVAISKRQPQKRIISMLDSGQRVFGENRVQEAYEHWSSLKQDYPDIKLHLVGPLQTNKAKEAVALFDVIQTVDREKLVAALAREMKKQQRNLPCFIQVNTGEEPQKAGVTLRDADKLITLAREQGINVAGLMCIPPANEPPAPHFALLRKIAEVLDKSSP